MQGRAGQGRAGQGRAGQGRAGQGRAAGQDTKCRAFVSEWVMRLSYMRAACCACAAKLKAWRLHTPKITLGCAVLLSQSIARRSQMARSSLIGTFLRRDDIKKPIVGNVEGRRYIHLSIAPSSTMTKRLHWQQQATRSARRH
jgi:hypothetical protein